MSTHFFDATLVPRIITELEGISISGGETQNVVKAERWDAYDRSSEYLVHVQLRTVSQRRTHSGDDWLVTRRLAIDCTISQDATAAETTDELLSRFEADVAAKLGEIETTPDGSDPEASLEDIDAEWFQNENPEIQDVGVSMVATYAWTEKKDTGAHTGPA